MRQASAQSEPGNLGLQAMHYSSNCAVPVLNSLHGYKEVGGCRSALQTKVQL